MSSVEPTKEIETVEELTKRAQAIREANVNAAMQAINDVCEKFGVVISTRTVIENNHIESAIVIKSKQ